jgi:dienelactone hydrolase
MANEAAQPHIQHRNGYKAAVMALSPMAFAKEAVGQRIDALLRGSELYKPEGEGPFPIVLQLHGCGGKKNLQERWAAVAKSAGWAVLVIDSYGHRNISKIQAYATVCTGLQLWGRERAGDLFAMMEWARQQPWVMPDRIAVAGWSHGGWTALDAMSMMPGRDVENTTRLTGLGSEPLAGLVGAFIIYPYQGIGALAPGRGLRVDVPVQAIVGTKDSVVGGNSVIKVLRRMKTPSTPIDVTVYEGATHAFDEIEAQDWRVRYDPGLTERSHRMYADFLRSAAERASPVR